MPSHTTPPRWLMATLAGCLCLLLVFLLASTKFASPAVGAAPSPSPTALPTPTPKPTATPEPTPTPEPTVTPEPTTTPEPTATPEPTIASESTEEPESAEEPDWSLAVPLGEKVDEEDWFSDAIIIGDSRTEGLRIYSGITSQANFITYTGLSIRGVNQDARVIRAGELKCSVLDFLATPSYGKIYIALGLNDLGRSSENFAQDFGQVVDRIRALQPEARIYIQAILPVNAGLCRSHGYSATNPSVDSFNQALSSLCQEKEVCLLGIPEGLLDENGELSASLTPDGVHLQKSGAALWLDYLLTHTGDQ